MRLAEAADTIKLINTYQDATTYANAVGRIDWPDPIAELFVADLVASGELYCFEEGDDILAAAKLSRQRDVRIWEDKSLPALYLAKLATSNEARGRDYFRSSVLPSITEQFGSKFWLRLDCLGDNERLQNFYLRLGFSAVGNAEFFSEKQRRTIVVRRFEKPVGF